MRRGGPEWLIWVAGSTPQKAVFPLWLLRQETGGRELTPQNPPEQAGVCHQPWPALISLIARGFEPL